ncbi:hypothetical protein ACFQ36_02585 [Arthrobacter sp. GCM10027362]|uniref:hypothetical protein n=1 Tax=Arthrobacter sp. GCM10027362 TaxID=3273379 RepID=UPI003639E8AA
MSTTEQFDVPAKPDEIPRVNGFGLASLVLGTFAVAVAFIPVLGLPALLLGPLAITFAGIGRARTPADTITGTAGLILGITGTLIALAVTVVVALSFGKYAGMLQNIPRSLAQAPSVTGAGQPSMPGVARAPEPAAVPTGQPAGKGCEAISAAGEGELTVTYTVWGEAGTVFNVDYGTPDQFGCVESVTTHRLGPVTGGGDCLHDCSHVGWFGFPSNACGPPRLLAAGRLARSAELVAGGEVPQGRKPPGVLPGGAAAASGGEVPRCVAGSNAGGGLHPAPAPASCP